MPWGGKPHPGAAVPLSLACHPAVARSVTPGEALMLPFRSLVILHGGLSETAGHRTPVPQLFADPMPQHHSIPTPQSLCPQQPVPQHLSTPTSSTSMS